MKGKDILEGFEFSEGEWEMLRANYPEFRNRFVGYYQYRWGLIPNLPTHLDNSNSIYELLAWLQRAYLNLLDDFLQLADDFEQFKKELIIFLETIIPEIIYNYLKSEEFKELIREYIKEWFDEFVEERLKEIEKRLDSIETQIKELTERIEVLETSNKDLEKIINHLTELGVWKDGDFIKGMGIAGGNINHFGLTQDGNYWIRTNKGKSEGDTVGGL